MAVLKEMKELVVGYHKDFNLDIEKTYNAYEIAEQIKFRNMWLAWKEEQVPYRFVFNCYDAKVFYKYELVVN